MSEASGVRQRRLVGFAGESGSGKTTLIEQLVVLLRGRGQQVSVIKHAHHRVEFDRPGKDSWRHREAGACEVLLVSPRLLALQRVRADGASDTVVEWARMLQPVDWILVEGYRHAPMPKIEVWRTGATQPPLSDSDPQVVAVATDEPARFAACRVPCLDLNQPASVADWLLAHAERFVLADET